MAGNSDGEDVSAMVPPKKRGAAAAAGGASCGQLPASASIRPCDLRAYFLHKCGQGAHAQIKPRLVQGEADPKRARGASGRAARAAGRAHEDEQSQVTGQFRV
jgi:hypothetical protein